MDLYRVRLGFILLIAVAICPTTGTADTGSGAQAAYFPELPSFNPRPIRDDLIYFMVTDRFNNADTVDYAIGEPLSMRTTAAAYATASNSATINFSNSCANRNCE